MEQTQPSRLSSSDRRATARALADWLRDRMIQRDYNLTARGGGQRRLSEQTGVSTASISRILNGEALNPDPESLRRIADVLALPFGDVLIRAGILTADELHAVHAQPSDRPPLTADQAAADLGIDDPLAIELYSAGVAAARDLQARRRKRAE
jgi:transcriptional regulator with XRE-family HTH domain